MWSFESSEVVFIWIVVALILYDWLFNDKFPDDFSLGPKSL